ncbi:MAG: N-acetylmuramoyl-L-alanine amidase [Bdellovibrionota bacterium]
MALKKILSLCFLIITSFFIFKLVENKNFKVVDLNQNYSGSKKKILIDPGHGGENHGATSATGIKEKAYTLELALDLKKHLSKNPAFKVGLTRKNDSETNSVVRSGLASHWKADVLISLHFNSVAESLLKKRIVNKQSYMFSEAYNGFMLIISDKNKNLIEKNKKLALSIGQALRTAGIKNYNPWSDYIPFYNQKAFNEFTKISTPESLYVNTNKYISVLDFSKVPTVLVEAGFIINPKEEQLINKPEWKQDFCKAISAGLINYFIESDKT